MGGYLLGAQAGLVRGQKGASIDLGRPRARSSSSISRSCSSSSGTVGDSPAWLATHLRLGVRALPSVIGGTPSIRLQAVPPIVADLADACNGAPRSGFCIVVDIIALFVGLDLVLAAAAALLMSGGLRSDWRARQLLRGSFRVFVEFWLIPCTAMVSILSRCAFGPAPWIHRVPGGQEDGAA